MTKRQLARLAKITPQPAPERPVPGEGATSERTLLFLGTSRDERANLQIIGSTSHDAAIYPNLLRANPRNYENPFVDQFITTGPHMVWLYNQYGQARICQVQDRLPGGLYPACPHCFGFHTESETDINACSKRRDIDVIYCQICRKPFYDTFMLGRRFPAGYATDPKVKAKHRAGVAKRLLAEAKLHLEAYHQGWYRAFTDAQAPRFSRKPRQRAR